MKFPDVGGGRSGGGTDSKLFVKLKSGEKLNGVFRGDPSIFRIHWVGGRSVRCPGQAQCENCAAEDKPKFRFRLNFITKDGGVWLAKIYEGNYQTYKDLKGLHESGYDLEETVVTVRREGENTDTKYHVIPTPKNGGLSPTDFAKITAVPLNPLSEAQAGAPAEAPSDDIPF
jgi:hypothetical protein